MSEFGKYIEKKKYLHLIYMCKVVSQSAVNNDFGKMAKIN